jgi:Cysteine-rich CPXCG
MMPGEIRSFAVQCPYCLEHMSLDVEDDVEGEYIQDCEVCCNPWQVRVVVKGSKRKVSIERSQ